MRRSTRTGFAAPRTRRASTSTTRYESTTSFSPDFFDTANHPELRFEGGPLTVAADGAVEIEGVLVVKGNSEPVTLTGTLTEPAIDPYGNTKRGLTLSGTVDRTALGLTWNAPLPDGGTMLADEVELTAALLLVPGEER